jgi:hypothetical protein
MPDLNERVAALESILSKVNGGDWSNDQDVPWWLAIRIRPSEVSKLGPIPDPWRQAALEQHVMSTVQLVAQAKGTQGEGLNRLTAEIIDDWCGTPPRFPPRPHWGVFVEQLGVLADRYPSGSMLSEAAFELARHVVTRAHALRGQKI